MYCGALKGCAHFWLHRVHQILDCFCDDSSKNDMFVRTEKQSSTVRDNSVRCFYDINLHAINIRVRRARDFEFSRWTSNNSMCWVSNQDLCWLLKCMSLKFLTILLVYQIMTCRIFMMVLNNTMDQSASHVYIRFAGIASVSKRRPYVDRTLIVR